MKYHDLLIAPDVFEYVAKYFSGDETCDDIDLKSYKENLSLKCLLLDTQNHGYNLYEILKKIAKNSSDNGISKLQIIYKQKFWVCLFFEILFQSLSYL